MNRGPFNTLYVYEERIPAALQQLVIDNLSQSEFAIDRMTYLTPMDEACSKMRWADAVFFAPGRRLPEQVFDNASGVKLMQLWSSGYDKFDTEAARSRGIPVANNGGANAISVAEHTIALMLAAYKWIPDSHRRTVEGKWAGNSHGMDMFQLYDKTLGIVGFGRIGREVARRARGFGMRVLYYDPVRPEASVERDLGAEYCEFSDLLSSADIVTLHVHLNSATAGTIGRSELQMMKTSATLLNVSRAQLVDTEALTKALNEGTIWGAGLDVYDEEPTKPNDPLLTHSHVVATPHMAGSTYDAYVLAIGNSVANIKRVRDGLKPLWVVNGVE
jgi:phosphoglycerate dehydrogenase-like enzyme